jgi:hypothetical protein
LILPAYIAGSSQKPRGAAMVNRGEAGRDHDDLGACDALALTVAERSSPHGVCVSPHRLVDAATR